jgi:pSer/pThr/pTyr-binding forkhead associated (FHA) protein
MSGVVLLILRILLAVLLYCFLAWALYTLWRDLKYQAELQSARKTRPLRLAFELEIGSQLRTFAQSEVIIGRSGNCDYILDDKTVSSRHTRLAYHLGQWWVEDLTSTNGTYLNGELVITPVVLANGDQLRCGQVTGRVELE